MQVFIPYSEPLLVAKCLDAKRLNKQILECEWILDAYKGIRPMRNHPIYKMYVNDQEWLTHYYNCLWYVRNKDEVSAEKENKLANACTPKWMTEELQIVHRRRLYEKAPELYSQFAEYGASTENWYIINNEIWKYNGGFIGSYPLQNISD